MTSDAKIGLLLGLVFIFIIAFIINGLPDFSRESNSNELTTTMARLQNNSPGIATKERKVRREVIRSKRQARKVRSSAPAPTDQNVRFSTALPKSGAIAKADTTASAKPIQPTRRKKIRPVASRRSSRPRFYVVREGDNLSDIAKKFYGSEEGNRKINITRIFQANRKLLRSQDALRIGHKLVIPPLAELTPKKTKASSAFSSGIFEKFKSIGKRQPSTVKRKVTHSKFYTVQEDDSLWTIAAEQLDNGSRYTELIQLNANVLDDEDNISIGMRLKMPAK